MEKVPCKNCGAQILPATAVENDGLCMPCSRGQTTYCKECGARTFKSMRGLDLDPLCASCRVKKAKEQPTEIHKFIEKHGGGDCSLLRQLFELDERLRREQKDRYIGLDLIDPPEPYGSESTPKNTIAFGETGGDWVHYSLVTVNGRVSDSSPVVLTYPATLEGPWEANVIVGESLRDFLSLGCEAGFEPIEDLALFWEQAIDELIHGPNLEEMDSKDLETLRIYREELNLEPWEDIRGRLEELQKRKRFLLKFPWLRLPWRKKRSD